MYTFFEKYKTSVRLMFSALFLVAILVGIFTLVPIQNAKATTANTDNCYQTYTPGELGFSSCWFTDEGTSQQRLNCNAPLCNSSGVDCYIVNTVCPIFDGTGGGYTLPPSAPLPTISIIDVNITGLAPNLPHWIIGPGDANEGDGSGETIVTPAPGGSVYTISNLAQTDCTYTVSNSGGGTTSMTVYQNTNQNYFNVAYVCEEITHYAPTVNAGPDQAITLPTSSVFSNGTATYNAPPTGSITSTLWSFVSGPTTPTILQNWKLTTTFSSMATTGTYVFRLTAVDSEDSSSSDDMQVVVSSPPLPDLTASVPAPTTATVGVAQTYTSTITNNGPVSTGAGFTNLFQISTISDGSSGVTDYPVTGMSALAGNGGNAVTSKQLTFNSAGTRYIRACADKDSAGDVDGVIAESNENNNCSMSTPWVELVVTSAPVPVVTITANPPSGTAPVTPTLTWSATNNPTYCTASDGWTGTKDPSGTNVAQPTINATTTYIINCTNGNGTGPNASATVTVSGVSGIDLTAGLVTPTFATAGVAKTFYATISNIGANSTGTGFTNVFQTSTNASTVLSQFDVSVATALAGGTSTDISKIIAFSPAGSTQYLRVCADKNKNGVTTISEGANEGNNCGAWQQITILAPGKNLIASAPPENTATAGIAKAYTTVITNIGSVAAGPPYNLYHAFNFDNDTNHGSGVVNKWGQSSSGVAIAANGGTEAITMSPPYPLTAGIWYVQACADMNLWIAETDENDNCSNWVQLTVTSPPAPDLVASAPSPTTATLNIAQTYTSTITNQGNLATPTGFTNLFQISQSSTGASGVTDYPVAGMAALLANGGNANTSKSITFPSTGTWYIRACADKDSQGGTGTITESNEGNNCSISTPWTAVTVNAPVITGTITGTNCIILKNASTCNSSVTWSTTNPIGVSSITKPVNVTLATGNTGTNVPLAVKYDFETFYLNNNTQTIDFVTVFSQCTAGTSYDGSKCAENSVGDPGICANGATNYPTCTTNDGGSCINGADNPPECSTKDGVCLNGAVNPPACTINSGGACLNGATNPPVCFNKKPLFKEN